MSDFCGLEAAAGLTSKDSRFSINVAWVACILGFTGIILFFAYMSRERMNIAGKITIRVSVTTGQRGTNTGRVSNISHQDGSAPNPETSHSAGAQTICTTGIDNFDAQGDSAPDQDLVQANAHVSTSNNPSDGPHNGAPGTSDKLPQSQHPTHQGASHTNSGAIHAGGIDANTTPSQGLGTSHTRGPQPTSSGTGTVGSNRRSSLDTYKLRELGYDPRLL